ncbi:hypothetical protein GPN2_20416 [Streptomyces murinus]
MLGRMERAPDIAALIAAERRESANVFEELAPAQWDAPSLCAGWRVREVVAHMLTGFRYPTARVLLELARARGSLNRMTDRLARRDAAAHQDRGVHDRRPGPGPARPSAPAPRTCCSSPTGGSFPVVGSGVRKLTVSSQRDQKGNLDAPDQVYLSEIVGIAHEETPGEALGKPPEEGEKPSWGTYVDEVLWHSDSRVWWRRSHSPSARHPPRPRAPAPHRRARTRSRRRSSSAGRSTAASPPPTARRSAPSRRRTASPPPSATRGPSPGV